MSVREKVTFRAGGPTTSVFKPDLQAAVSGAITLLGDVSEFQPNIVDAVYLQWSKAIVIRAMYGDAHDDQAWFGGARRAALHAGGVKFLGIYQYLVATQDAAAQAHAFVDLIGTLKPGEIPICDIEEGTGQEGRWIAWRNVIQSAYPQLAQTPTGRPWCYAGLNFGAANGLPMDWVAAYQSSEPTTPHDLWQFTDAFNVPGVGSIDCSKYHGTIDELVALITPKSQPTPPPKPNSGGTVVADGKVTLRQIAHANNVTVLDVFVLTTTAKGGVLGDAQRALFGDIINGGKTPDDVVPKGVELWVK
jgi:hypothetical protein